MVLSLIHMLMVTVVFAIETDVLVILITTTIIFAKVVRAVGVIQVK